MKKITAIFLTAVLLASLTGCKPNGEGSDTPTDFGDSSAITDSSDNSDSPNSSTAPESAPEPSKPAGDPTFLTAPDGTPIYTSEISEIYKGSEERGNKETITLEQAEQLAYEGGDFTVKCDSFFSDISPRGRSTAWMIPKCLRAVGANLNSWVRCLIKNPDIIVG